MIHDVVILGDGPAGLATAIHLNQQGLPPLLVIPVSRIQRPRAESLAASARTSLIRLGVWEAFQQGSHTPCLGNCSAWGGETLHYQDSIQSPEGGGWHLHREELEALLRRAALGSGATQLRTEPAWQVQSCPDGTFQLRTDQGLVQARMLVDATGRNSRLARMLGIRRLQHDPQIALSALLRPGNTAPASRFSMVEAVENGWWYSAPLPGGDLACLFFTDPDLADTKSLVAADGWRLALAATHHTRLRVEAIQGQLIDAPQFVAAGSSRLETMHGPGWVAAGDAAMTFDPLSAHGVSIALASGADAARAIVRHFGGDSDALPAYGQRLVAAYDRYYARRAQIYRGEMRWKDHPFWQRRHIP